VAYAIRRQTCKRIDRGVGWVKVIGDLRKLPRIGIDKTRAWAT
jgi:hypothetical protein